MKHESDGVSYASPKNYKCKHCGQRLTKDELDNNCEQE